MDTLRRRTIRLASEHPELRPLLLPILKEAATCSPGTEMNARTKQCEPLPANIVSLKVSCDNQISLFDVKGARVLSQVRNVGPMDDARKHEIARDLMDDLQDPYGTVIDLRKALKKAGFEELLQSYEEAAEGFHKVAGATTSLRNFFNLKTGYVPKSPTPRQVEDTANDCTLAWAWCQKMGLNKVASEFQAMAAHVRTFV